MQTLSRVIYLQLLNSLASNSLANLSDFQWFSILKLSPYAIEKRDFLAEKR
jgi:hypothetical protein